MTHPDRLDPDDEACLEQILARCPDLADAADDVRGFATMMTNRNGHSPAPASTPPPLNQALLGEEPGGAVGGEERWSGEPVLRGGEHAQPLLFSLSVPAHGHLEVGAAVAGDIG